MASPLSDQEVKDAIKSPDESTSDFIFQQTMFRIKDPKASLAFYTGLVWSASGLIWSFRSA